MSKKILLVAATGMEVDALKKIPGLESRGNRFTIGNCEVELLVTGVGAVATAYGLTRRLYMEEQPDLVINIGIAGSFSPDISIGEVVAPLSDCFADMGIEREDGITTIFEMGFEERERYPFEGGRIMRYSDIEKNIIEGIKSVKAITVNSVSSLPGTIRNLSVHYNPDIETMEGAAFFYICALEKVPFLALRAISNVVGPRDKENGISR